MQLRLPHVTDTKARFEAKPQTKKHDDIDPDESERNTVVKDISFSVKELAQKCEREDGFR